jgi:hypothetical protein
MGSCFLNFLGQATTRTLAGQLRVISFFNDDDPNGVIQHGLNWGNVGLLAAACGVLFAASLWLSERRDIGL